MKTLIIITVAMLSITSGCGPNPRGLGTSSPSEPSIAPPDIPQLLAMPNPPRENIRRTCRERWVIKNMNMKTFSVRPDRDEFVIQCDGIIDGELRQCVIRTDSNGNWINDGNTKKNP